MVLATQLLSVNSLARVHLSVGWNSVSLRRPIDFEALVASAQSDRLADEQREAEEEDARSPHPTLKGFQQRRQLTLFDHQVENKSKETFLFLGIIP